MMADADAPAPIAPPDALSAELLRKNFSKRPEDKLTRSDIDVRRFFSRGSVRGDWFFSRVAFLFRCSARASLTLEDMALRIGDARCTFAAVTFNCPLCRVADADGTALASLAICAEERSARAAPALSDGMRRYSCRLCGEAVGLSGCEAAASMPGRAGAVAAASLSPACADRIFCDQRHELSAPVYLWYANMLRVGFALLAVD
jgi:hypothetical protein